MALLDTNYYTIFPGNGPGNIQDISPYHAGITSLNNSTSKATASATKSTFIDSVESAIKRAKIANADPAHFSRIDPITLKSVLEQTSNLKLTFETTELGESGSELQLSLSTFPEVVEQEGPGSELHLTLDTSSDVVEVTLVILDSHEAAITRMRHALSCISAPLDVVLAQTKPLGHYSLQGIGYAVFVRGNVFVKMTALPSYKELDTIAAEVDRYLKERAGGPKSLSKSRIESLGVLSRVVKVGETFEVAVKVAEAGSMTAFTNPGIVQLLEVDAENATFKFHGTAAGTIDIQLVFAHEDTLQTTTATVHVEVIDDGPENKQGPVEPPVKYHGRG
jgi:hypothetical protein